MRAPLIALTLVSLASASHASLIAYDGFNYTPGTVLGTASKVAADKGTWTSQGATYEVTAVSGNLSAASLSAPAGNSVQLNNGSGANASRLFLGTNTSGSLYYSFAVSIPGLPTATSYFAGFDYNTSNTPYLAAAGLYIRTDPKNSALFDLGIHNSTANSTGWTPGYATNTTLLVVGSLTFNGSDTLDVYGASDEVSADAAPTTHTAVASGTESIASVTNFYLRGNSGEPTGINIDELRVGTTFADVVPEPASLSLLGIGAAALLRRRRAL